MATIELRALLNEIEIELEKEQARAALRLLVEQQRGVRDNSLEEFLISFVRVGVGVARSVADAASYAQAERELKSYTAVLTLIWSGPDQMIADAGAIAGQLDDAYLTLRSFLTVVEATTPASRKAAAHCEEALQAVSGYFGAATMARLDAHVQAVLTSNRISGIGRDLRDGPGSMAAWGYIDELPAIPDASVDLSRLAAASGFRKAPPRAESIEELSQPKPEEAHLYEVWFGTNRALIDPADPAKGFANQRDALGTVHYGTCSVEIPRTHKFGSTGTPFWKRWLRLEFTDDHLKLRKISPLDSDGDFLDSLREELAAQTEAERGVLVYLHGYNTTFEEAALRAAQIGFDLKVPGATAFYSWPSMAEVKGYPADIARVEASETQIADFLTAIATKADARRVHVIAHSMGNRGFARAIARITSSAAASGVRFGQIILAAPDVDVDLFKQLAIAYPKISDRTTMYVSAKDKALAMSSWLQDSDRAGFTPPVTVLDGIDTIEVTNIDVTLLGHGYFAEAEPLLYDIKELIEAGKAPGKRLRIEAEDRTGRRVLGDPCLRRAYPSKGGDHGAKGISIRAVGAPPPGHASMDRVEIPR